MSLEPARARRASTPRFGRWAALLVAGTCAALAPQLACFNYLNRCLTNDHCPIPEQCSSGFCLDPSVYGGTACSVDADCPGATCYEGWCSYFTVPVGDGDGDGTSCSGPDECGPSAYCGPASTCVEAEGTVVKPPDLWDTTAVYDGDTYDALSGAVVVAGNLYIGKDYWEENTGSVEVDELSFPGLKLITGDLEITLQRDAATVSFPDLTQVGGSITVHGNDIQNLRFPALQRLRWADGYTTSIDVSDNRVLGEISFPALEEVDDVNIAINGEGNGAITPAPAVIDLSKLSSVSGDFDIDGGDYPVDEIRVGTLTSVGWLELSDLTYDVSGWFNNLTEITNQVRLRWLKGSPTISFPVLTTVANTFEITQCDDTTTLSAPLLTSVGENMTVTGNDVLSSVEFTALTDVGLSFDMSDNPQLDACLAKNVGDATGLPPADLDLSGNLGNADACP